MKRFAQSVSVLTLVLCLLTAGPLWAQGKVDINSADVTTLKNLQGIGDVKANAIIKYRQMNGPFQSLDDLKSVPGIGDKIVRDNKSNIAIGRGGRAMSKPKSKAMKDVKGKSNKTMKGAKGKANKSMKSSADKAKARTESTTGKMKDSKKMGAGKADKSMKTKATDKTKKGMSSSKKKVKKEAASSSKKMMKKGSGSTKSKAKKVVPKTK